MSGLSRRDFIKRLGNKLSDRRVQDGAETHSAAQEWVPVAKLSELRPGTRRSVRAGDIEIALTSTREGVQATLSDGKCIALRSGANGWVEVNTSVEWLPESGMSHLTGELTKLSEIEG